MENPRTKRGIQLELGELRLEMTLARDTSSVMIASKCHYNSSHSGTRHQNPKPSLIIENPKPRRMLLVPSARQSTCDILWDPPGLRRPPMLPFQLPLDFRGLKK